jgi:hypothetical protein
MGKWPGDFVAAFSAHDIGKILIDRFGEMKGRAPGN